MELRTLRILERSTGAKPLAGGIMPAVPIRLKPALVLNSTLGQREDITPDIARLRVRPDGAVPAFRPGQYFSLGLNLRAGPILRPYSTASPMGATDGLEFLVRRVPAGALTPSLWNLAVGERLWIGPPKGLFTLRPGDDRAHLLISAGTGIAPFISMLAELLERPQPPRIAMAHGVSYQTELAYRRRLEAIATERGEFVYTPTVSRPSAPENAGWTGRSGRVERIVPDLWQELGLRPDQTVAYLCGNPDMVDASRAALLDLGMPAEAVLHENYWALPSSTARAAAE